MSLDWFINRIDKVILRDGEEILIQSRKHAEYLHSLNRYFIYSETHTGTISEAMSRDVA